MRFDTAKLAPVAGFIASASLALALGSLIYALTPWPWTVWLFSPVVFFAGGALGTAIESGMTRTADQKQPEGDGVSLDPMATANRAALD
jgi:CDP-diglyceride synthetase